jgi:hypothetical protein
MIELEDFTEIALARRWKRSAIENDAFPAYEIVGGSATQFLDVRSRTHPHEIEADTPTDESAEELYNPDAQARYAAKHGQDALARLLAPHGLKIGQTKKRDRPKADPSKLAPSTNPYHPNFKGDRTAKIAELTRVMGTAGLAALARAQNKKIDGTPLARR